LQKISVMYRVVIVSFLMTISLIAQASFNDFFLDQSMRIDYVHAGDQHSEQYYLQEIRKEPYWGGSVSHLIDTYKYGKYFFEVYDDSTGSLIYSRGYSSLFGEWQTTDDASLKKKAFFESVIFPFPKKSVIVRWYARDYDGNFVQKMEQKVNPAGYFIKPGISKKYPVYQAYHSGDPHEKVDIVILPDGYTKDEMELFKSDCDKFAKELFKYQPYSEYKDRFNISGVLAPSEDSGNDIPVEGIWKNTQLSTSFYTFNSERYCMTEDNKSVRDLAANVAYDQIYILVNNEKYGGGAIYNFYNVSVNSNKQAGKIFVHELGHGFAGLADAYYDNSTSYKDFYNISVEPWEPNITTLVRFDTKWKHLVEKNTPIPTPETKEYQDVVGAFEGGGYIAKGVYRPKQDCMMKTFKGSEFCEACQEAIIKMILFYSE